MWCKRLRFQNVQGGYGNTDKVDLFAPEYFDGIKHRSAAPQSRSCRNLTARRRDRSAATCAQSEQWSDIQSKAAFWLYSDVLRQVLAKPTNDTSRSYSAGTDRDERVSELCTAKEQPQRDEAIRGMRHRYAGAVHQHQVSDRKHESSRQSRDPVAPVFSLPPPPSSHRDRTLTTAAHRQSLQELPCLSQPSRRPVRSGDPLPLASYATAQRPAQRGGEPNPGQPAHLQQDPWAPAVSLQPQSEKQPVFPSCHCSFSEQEASPSQNQPHPDDSLPPQPSPPFPPPIPPPPTSSSASLLFSRASKRGDRLQRSANHYQQASIVERCRGGGGAGGHQDHGQLLQQQQQRQQQQHSHLRLQQRDPSPERIRANSQKGRSLNVCKSTEANRGAFESQTQDLQQQQIPQLRAQQQLLVGSSLPINYCASGSEELCRTHQAPLLQQQEQQQQQQQQQGALGLCPQRPQHCEQERRISEQGDQVPSVSHDSRVSPPAAHKAYAGNSSATASNSSKDSPNYGSSYHLWPESPHKGEERIRIDPHKVDMSHFLSKMGRFFNSMTTPVMILIKQTKVFVNSPRTQRPYARVRGQGETFVPFKVPKCNDATKVRERLSGISYLT